MSKSCIYHGGNLGGSGGGFASASTINNYSGGGALPTSSFQPAAGQAKGASALITTHALSCNLVDGFTNRFIANKVFSDGDRTLNEMGIFIYNSYGSREYNLGIYDELGALISSTGIQTAQTEVHKTVFSNLLSSVDIMIDQNYWLGLWANGLDIPSLSSFANFSSNFPDGLHGVEDKTALSLPLSIGTLPATTKVIPTYSY